MNFSASESIFAMLFVFSASLCISSEHMTKRGERDPLLSSIRSDEKSDEEWRNGDVTEKLIMKDDTGRRENAKASFESRTNLDEETENVKQKDGYWAEADHGNLAHRQPRNKSARNHRRRHSRRLYEEIESLHGELSHVETNLDEMTKKETHLQQEIDELRKLSIIKEMRTKHDEHRDESNEQRLEILLPETENAKHHSARSKKIVMRFHEPEGIVDMSDLLEEELDLLENEDQDLEDQYVGRKGKLREEVKDLREKVDKVLNRNRELRRRNKELRRQLCESMIQHSKVNKAHENGRINTTLNAISGKTREDLEEEALAIGCGKFFREEEVGFQKKEKPHQSKDKDFIKDLNSTIRDDEDIQRQDASFVETRAKRISRRNKKRRPFLNRVGETKRRKLKNSGFHDHDADELIEEQKAGEPGRQKEDDQNLENRELDRDNSEERSEIWISSRRVSDGEDDKISGRDSEKFQDGAVVSKTADYDFETERDSETEVDVELPEEEANLTISKEDEDKEKVYDHIASVDDAIFCGKPQAVVVYPSDEYPVPNKYYTPQGTILHRCGNHSGCCPNEHLTCVPAKKETVALHFFAAVLDGSSSAVPHIEKLHFTNHTKCGCVFKHHAHYYL